MIHVDDDSGVWLRTESPAVDKKSVPEGLVISLKLLPFTLTAKGVELSKEPARTRVPIPPEMIPRDAKRRSSSETELPMRRLSAARIYSSGEWRVES